MKYCRLLFILIAVSLSTSCREDVGIPVSDDLMDLPTVEFALIQAESGNLLPMERIADSWPDGAWFALAEQAVDGHFPQAAEAARLRSTKDDPHPFAELSLSRLLSENPRALKRPLSVLRRAEKRHGTENSLAAARIAVLASLGKAKRLRGEYELFLGESYEAPVLAAVLEQSPEDPELRAVGERFILQADNPGALSVLPAAAFEGSIGEYGALLGARVDFHRGRFDEALEQYRTWLEASIAQGAACDLEKAPPVFREMADAAGKTGLEEEWAEYLLEKAAELGGAKGFGAAFEAGRLYRAIKDYTAAEQAFAAAADKRPAGLDRDRALWYRLRVMYEQPRVASDHEIKVLYGTWNRWANPERFSDRLEEFLHHRVRRGEWTLLEEAWRNYGDQWPASTRSQGALILAFAYHERRLAGGDPRELLEIAAASDPFSWSGLRAAGLLDIIPSIEVDSAAASSMDLMLSADDQIISLYLSCGLNDLAAKAVLSAWYNYSPQTIRAVAQSLASRDPRLSIRIAGLSWRHDEFAPQREDFLLRHPMPYGDAAADAALAEDLPPWIFHGLIRTESAWDTEAVSRSGARGLSQFMPPTWEEWVRRMRYPEDADPHDPEANMALGAAYLDWLYEREWTFGWQDSLASYNAGGGRVRQWRRERPGYGDDLFGYSLPVEEPRSYISKVLSAATLYGYLYAGETPRALHEKWGLEMIEVR